MDPLAHAGRDHGEDAGRIWSAPDKALYLAALKNTIPMYSTTGKMDPKGAQAVLDVFSQSSPEVAKAKIDLSKTYTNKFVEAAQKGMRSGAT